MSKQKQKKTEVEGIWFERGRHWCQYPVATSGPSERKRGPEAVKRRAQRKQFAKQVMYGAVKGIGFKRWLSEQSA